MSKRPPFASSAGRPNASDQALERALVALRMQRPDEAERITADILKAERGNARAAHVHGQALLMQNRAADDRLEGGAFGLSSRMAHGCAKRNDS